MVKLNKIKWKILIKWHVLDIFSLSLTSFGIRVLSFIIHWFSCYFSLFIIVLLVFCFFQFSDDRKLCVGVEIVIFLCNMGIHWISIWFKNNFPILLSGKFISVYSLPTNYRRHLTYSIKYTSIYSFHQRNLTTRSYKTNLHRASIKHYH